MITMTYNEAVGCKAYFKVLGFNSNEVETASPTCRTWKEASKPVATPKILQRKAHGGRGCPVAFLQVLESTVRSTVYCVVLDGTSMCKAILYTHFLSLLFCCLFVI